MFFSNRHLIGPLLSKHRRFALKVGFASLFIFSVHIVMLPQADVAAKDASKGSGAMKAGKVAKQNEQAFLIMQQQLNAYQEQLQESESALQAFQEKHGIISLESQINQLLQQRQALNVSLNQAANQRMGFKEKLTWVQSQISQVPKEVPLSSTVSEQGIIGSAKNKLLGLQLKEQQLLSKYTVESPHIKAVHQEMELIAMFIKDQEDKQAGSVTRGKNPLYAEMEMELFSTQAALVSAEAQSAVIEQQVIKVDKELERLRRLRPGLDGLKRQLQANEANYLSYLTKVGTTPPQDYKVQVGDQLDIKFFFNPELNESIPVRPDGRIALQLVGELSVVGHTVEEIRAILIKNYSGQLKNPEIAVLLRTSHVRAGESASQGGMSNVGMGTGNAN